VTGVVVDANVVAYAVFGPPGVREAAWNALGTADAIAVPDLFFPEYASAVWQWARARQVDVAGFLGALDDAEALIDRVVPSQQLWRSAVGLALRRDHSVYDAVYVALADKLGTRAVTFDEGLLRAFPAHTVHARDLSA
jgi:predicted nucleic acid-binding protein